MAPPLLTLRDIRLTFGGAPLLEGAELVVAPDERVCLVGRNGSGKSTLLKIAAGLVEADSGERFLHPAATVRYLPQEPDLAGHSTTLAYVEAGLAPGDEARRAAYLLESLGLTGAEDPAHLSGGEARRAGLARALAPAPDVLLLDEPTNHLDLPAIEWLEAELMASRSALVLISHDRRFLERLSRATVWLDRGVTRRLDQGFSAFEAWRDEVLAKEEADRHKLGRKLVAEADWLRYGVTARRKRNMRRVREIEGMRQARREARRAQGNVAMAAVDGGLTGKLVIEAIGIGKRFGERALVTNLSLRIARGDRVGLVGPNGAGKTTLLKLLTGAMAPDEGTVGLGANLEAVTLDQGRESLDPTTTLTEALTGGRGDTVVVGGTARHVVAWMKDFLFPPEQARTPLAALSGGERGRVMLARALSKPSNLLILDEPTNDLDLETLDLLQELVAGYAGTVLLVSHDRDFLDRTVTSVLMAEGNGRWLEYAGGYTDMLAQRGRGVEARKAEAKPTTPRSAAVATTRPAAPPAPPRFGPKERKALETLPGRLEALRRDRAKLHSVLADPDLFGRDAARFGKASAMLARVENEIATDEEAWLRLEMLREAVEGV